MNSSHTANNSPVAPRAMLGNIARIAVPAVVSNISVPLLSLVDTAITGHLGKQSYLGAIAVGGMLLNVLFWVMGFLRMGTSGLTAQAFGSGDSEKMAASLARALLLALGIGLIILILSPLIQNIAFALVSCPEGVEPPARAYFGICIMGAPAVLGIFAFSGWFLGMQNSVWPMLVALVQNVVNIIASLALVYVFDMKVEGVAAGTVIGEYTALAMCGIIWKLRYSRSLPRVDFRHVARRAALMRFLNVNRDIFLRSLFIVAVMSCFTAAGARLDTVTLAANALLMQLFVMFSYLTDGIAFSVEALSGRYIGARNRGAFDTMTGVAAKLSVVVAAVFALAYLAGGHAFLALLTNDPETVSVAARYLGFAAMIPIASMAAFLLDGIFVGATASRQMLAATSLSAVAFFGILLPLFGLWHNFALWTAFIAYLLTRSLVMLVLFPRMRRKAFE